MLMSVGFGMIAGLAMWVVGIWGKSASLADAALPPPYTKEFFAARLREWVMSLQPLDRRSARDHRDRLDDPDGSPRATSGAHVRPGLDLVAAAVPRNAHGAHRDRRPVLPVHERERGAHGARRPRLVRRDPLVPPARGTEAHRGRARGGRDPRCARLGLQRRPDEPMGRASRNQWANQGVRSSLAAVHEVVADAGHASERPGR